MNPTLLGFTLATILVATVGKFLGALAGGRLGGLSTRESLALATGLNARGSTEVIIASIGLSMGVLGTELYTMIVAMAVVTTLAMPPTLRWMLARVPVTDDEAVRLEKEEAEATESVPKMERALVYIDESPNAALGAHLAGTFAAGRQIVTTVIKQASLVPPSFLPQPGSDIVSLAAATVQRQEVIFAAATDAPHSARLNLDELIHDKTPEKADALEVESAKGYSIAFVGLARPLSDTAQRFDTHITSLTATFSGPIAIAMNGSRFNASSNRGLRILVPTGGTAHARLAIEIALALVKATGGSLTVVHVFEPDDEINVLRGRSRRLGLSVLIDARQLGKRSGVRVDALTRVNAKPERVIRQATASGDYDLVVLSAALRIGNPKFLGSRSEALVRGITIPMLLIVR